MGFLISQAATKSIYDLYFREAFIAYWSVRIDSTAAVSSPDCGIYAATCALYD